MTMANLIAKGEMGRPSDLLLHAQAMHDLANTIDELFPAGTGPDATKTDARPEVWARSAEFATACQKLETETGKLVEMAKAGDLAAAKTQLGAVGPACGDCHDVFRVEEKH
jgi:cytochrome c556